MRPFRPKIKQETKRDWHTREAPKDGGSFFAAYENFQFISPDGKHNVSAQYFNEPPHGDSYHIAKVDGRRLPGYVWGGSFAWSSDSKYFCCSWMPEKSDNRGVRVLARHTIVIEVNEHQYFLMPEYFANFQIQWPQIVEIKLVGLDPKNFKKLVLRSFCFSGAEEWTSF
jgi:hypothetical protein